MATSSGVECTPGCESTSEQCKAPVLDVDTSESA